MTLQQFRFSFLGARGEPFFLIPIIMVEKG